MAPFGGKKVEEIESKLEERLNGLEGELSSKIQGLSEDLRRIEIRVAELSSTLQELSSRPELVKAGVSQLLEKAEKVAEELGELDEAVASGSAAEIEHELGDLLFAVAQWGRHLGQFPEEAIRAACARFESRFSTVERLISERGMKMEDCEMEELEAAWQEAKRS